MNDKDAIKGLREALQTLSDEANPFQGGSEGFALRSALRKAREVIAATTPDAPIIPVVESDEAPSPFNRMTAAFDFGSLWEHLEPMSNYSAVCDDRCGELEVTIDPYGDVHVTLKPGEHTSGTPFFRARTYAGGGKSERIHKALLLLALAFSEEEAAKNKAESAWPALIGKVRKEPE